MSDFIAIRNPVSRLLHAVRVEHKYCLCGSTKVRGIDRHHTANEGRIVETWQGEVDGMAKKCAVMYQTWVALEKLG